MMLVCPRSNVLFVLYLFSGLDFFLTCIDSAVDSSSRLPSSYEANKTKKDLLRGWNTLGPQKHLRRLRKRSSRKSLGEKCVKFSDCDDSALCMHGVCSCAYDFYARSNKKLPQKEEKSSSSLACRKKIKFGYLCTLTEDCEAYDSNSLCLENMCKCVNGTHFIGSRSLVPHDRKCYRILEREGDSCEIDEQCSRLADNQHKCRCVGSICDCTSVERYGGCSICHENIKRTFFGGAAFLALLLSSRLFTRMRHRSGSQHASQQQQQQQQPLQPLDRALIGGGPAGRRTNQMLSSSTAPSVSLRAAGGLRADRRVAASLPNVFLIDRHNNLASSQTTHFLLPANGRLPPEDAPPSYEDIVESDQLVWSEPPPAYEEVALKCAQPRRP